MVLNFVQSQSNNYPVLLDTNSSKTTVYIRRNVTSETKTDEMSDTPYTVYKYEEAAITKEEYREYLLEKQRADIDYIALMNGIDLEEDQYEQNV